MERLGTGKWPVPHLHSATFYVEAGGWKNGNRYSPGPGAGGWAKSRLTRPEPGRDPRRMGSGVYIEPGRISA